MRIPKYCNLYNCELIGYNFDDISHKYPVAYQLVFNYKEGTIYADITVDSLLQIEQNVVFNVLDGNNVTKEDIENFLELIKEGVYTNKIRKACRKAWDLVLDNLYYDYLGCSIC